MPFEFALQKRVIFSYTIIVVLLIGVAATSLITMRRYQAIVAELRTAAGVQTEAAKEADAVSDLAELLTAAASLGSLLAVFFAFRLTEKDLQRRTLVANELKAARRRAIEASELKSAFLANMSHEIRTPMNGILGLSEMLMRLDLTPEARRYTDSIQRSAHSLLAIINGILDLSKIESGKLELETSYFEIASVVDEAVSTVSYAATSKQVGLEVHRDDDVPPAFIGDSLRIRQVLINLLNNAVKFSDSGTVRLFIRFTPKAESMGNLEFEVRDEGIGIDAATTTQIFEAFQQADQSTTRRFGGTGLGLSITKELVNLMKGHITVQSELGRGSTFRVEIPLAPVALMPFAPRREDAVPVATDRTRLKVLVAEDNDINREVLTSMFKALGHDAHFAENGKLAVERLRQEPFDLIFMDCHMPEMDGFEATRAIRTLEKENQDRVPIIAITASAIKGDLEKCIESGMNDYIAKPMTLQDLAAKIELWSPRAELPSNQVLQLSAIDGLRELGDNSDPELIPKLMNFFEESRNEISSLKWALGDKKLKDVRDLAHRMKSAHANLGLIRLQRACQRVEQAAQNGEAGVLPFLVTSVEIEYELAALHLRRAGLLKGNDTWPKAKRRAS